MALCGVKLQWAGWGAAEPPIPGPRPRQRRVQTSGWRRVTMFPERVPAARIPIERFAGPLFVAGAHDDQVRDSGGRTEAIVRTRAPAGRETEALVYREAGHALTGTGWAPTKQYNAGPMKMGGRPEADAAAQAEVFTRLLAFLQRTAAP